MQGRLRAVSQEDKEEGATNWSKCTKTRRPMVCHGIEQEVKRAVGGEMRDQVESGASGGGLDEAGPVASPCLSWAVVCFCRALIIQAFQSTR